MLKQMNIKAGWMMALTVSVFQFCAAQNVGNDEVIIMKDYEAKVKDADKVILSPVLPETTETKPELSYNVPSKDFKDILFEPNPLKPIGRSNEKIERVNNSYLKVGFGSQLTPLVEFAYNDNKTKNLRFGVFYNHLSQYGFKIKNQKFAVDEPGVYLSYLPKTFEIGTSFRFKNNRVHFYGSPDTVFSDKAIRQEYRDYDAAVFFKNAQKNVYDLDFNTGLRFDYYQETYGKGHEYFIAGNVDLLKHIKKYWSVGGGFNVDYSLYKTGTQNLQRNLFFLTLQGQFNNDDWKAKAAFTFGTDGTSFYPLPDLFIEKRLYQHSLIAFAGWDIRYQKNSYRSFTQINPFLDSDVQLKNSRVSSFYGGFKGTISGFSYMLQFAYKQLSNMPLFYTDYFDQKRFYVSYDSKVKDLNGHIELGYNLRDEFKILLSTDINSYTLSQNKRAWYEPLFKGNLKATYNFKRKIIAGIDVYGFSTYYGFVYPNNEQKISGTADINVSLEYILNKHFSFFGMANNLAHQRYQKWVNYPVYGVNGLVGVKFSF